MEKNKPNQRHFLFWSLLINLSLTFLKIIFGLFCLLDALAQGVHLNAALKGIWLSAVRQAREGPGLKIDTKHMNGMNWFPRCHWSTTWTLPCGVANLKSTMKSFTRTRAAKDLLCPTLSQQQTGSGEGHPPTPALPLSKTAHLCMESLMSYLSVRRGQSDFFMPQSAGKLFKLHWISLKLIEN